MYTSTFTDWFCQAAIDYMLGFRTLSVFSEFLLKLQSSDPRELVRLSNIRAEAVATCVSRVLEEGEKLLSGWTLFSPGALSTKLGDKFEEKVLLLVRKCPLVFFFSSLNSLTVWSVATHHSKCSTRFTSAFSAVFQSYDYNLEKVKISTRIPLYDIVGISKGYPLTPCVIVLLPIISYFRRLYRIPFGGDISRSHSECRIFGRVAQRTPVDARHKLLFAQ